MATSFVTLPVLLGIFMRCIIGSDLGGKVQPMPILRHKFSTGAMYGEDEYLSVAVLVNELLTQK